MRICNKRDMSHTVTLLIITHAPISPLPAAVVSRTCPRASPTTSTCRRRPRTCWATTQMTSNCRTPTTRRPSTARPRDRVRVALFWSRDSRDRDTRPPIVLITWQCVWSSHRVALFWSRDAICAMNVVIMVVVFEKCSRGWKGVGGGYRGGDGIHGEQERVQDTLTRVSDCGIGGEGCWRLRIRRRRKNLQFGSPFELRLFVCFDPCLFNYCHIGTWWCISR